MYYVVMHSPAASKDLTNNNNAAANVIIILVNDIANVMLSEKFDIALLLS